MACCNSDSRAIFSQNRTSVMRVTSWQGPLPSPGPRKLLWSWAALAPALLQDSYSDRPASPVLAVSLPSL